MGNLYIVATPIGNLQDITLRAIDVLKTVDYIACEDTRETGNLISVLIGKENVKARYISYYEHNEEVKIPEILTLLIQGKNIALVSDAGTPTISDPGFKLVRECIKQDIRVESVPGAFAGTSALVSSGLPTDKFTYLGFLPKRQGHRMTLLKNLIESNKFLKSTYILFVSPHEFSKTLEELKNVFGDIEVVIARELTKMHEEIKIDKVSNFINQYKQNKIKGEIVLLFNLNN